MIKKYYYKNQLYIITLIFIGVLFSSYFYFHHKKIEQNNNFITTTILDVSCGGFKRSSLIKLIINNKDYYLEIGNCKSKKRFDKVNVLYDETYDKYFVSGRSEKNIRQIKFLSIFLIIFLLPWKGIFQNTKFKKY